MQRSEILGKREAGEQQDLNNLRPKRMRRNAEYGTPESDKIEIFPSESRDQSSLPRPGTLVERNRVRRTGPYVIGHELDDKGTQQIQYLARKENTDEYYILKILTYSDETELENKYTLYGRTLLHNEYSILSMLSDVEGVYHQHGMFQDTVLEENIIVDPNRVVRAIYSGRTNVRLVLVLDCVLPHDFSKRSLDYVTLEDYLHSRASLKELEALKIFYNIVKVIEVLHNRNIIHRDLKLNQIVVNCFSKKVVIRNFSHARHLCSENDDLYEQRGSGPYLSPDLLTGKPYKGKPTDMWALGIILYCMLYGAFPFEDTLAPVLYKKIRQANFNLPRLHNTCRFTIRLVRLLLNPDPVERATASAIRMELETTIARLSKNKVEIDQIVPVIENLVDNKGDQKSRRRKNADAESSPPSYELWKGSLLHRKTSIQKQETTEVMQPTLSEMLNESTHEVPRQAISDAGSYYAIVQQQPIPAVPTQNVVQPRTLAQAVQQQVCHVVPVPSGVYAIRRSPNTDPIQQPQSAIPQQFHQRLITAQAQQSVPQRQQHNAIAQSQDVRHQSFQQQRNIPARQIPNAIVPAQTTSSQSVQRVQNAIPQHLRHFILVSAQQSVLQLQQSNALASQIVTLHYSQQQRNTSAQQISNVVGPQSSHHNNTPEQFQQRVIATPVYLVSQPQQPNAIVQQQDVGPQSWQHQRQLLPNAITPTQIASSQPVQQQQNATLQHQQNHHNLAPTQHSVPQSQQPTGIALPQSAVQYSPHQRNISAQQIPNIVEL